MKILLRFAILNFLIIGCQSTSNRDYKLSNNSCEGTLVNYSLYGFEPRPIPKLTLENSKKYRIYTPLEMFEAGLRLSYVMLTVCAEEFGNFRFIPLSVTWLDKNEKVVFPFFGKEKGLTDFIMSDDESKLFLEFSDGGKEKIVIQGFRENNTNFSTLRLEEKNLEGKYVINQRRFSFGQFAEGEIDGSTKCSSGYTYEKDLVWQKAGISMKMDRCIKGGTSGTRAYEILKIKISDQSLSTEPFIIEKNQISEFVTYPFPQTSHHNEGESCTIKTPFAKYKSDPKQLGAKGSVTVSYFDGASKKIKLLCDHWILNCFQNK